MCEEGSNRYEEGIEFGDGSGVGTQSYGLWRQDGKQRDNCNAGTGTDRVRSERKGDDAGRLQCGAGSDQMVRRTV